MNDQGEDWIVVTSKSRKGKRNEKNYLRHDQQAPKINVSKTFHYQRNHQVEVSHKSQVIQLKKRIDSILENMVCDKDFFENLTDLIKKKVVSNALKMDIVCYGTGSFQNSTNAKYQIACAILLRKSGLFPNGDLLLYDPILTSIDKEIAREYKITIISVNENAKRKAKTETFFFMPHCGIELYHNLLEENWNIDNIQNVWILGNSFSSYGDRILSKDEKEKYLIFKHLSYITEISCHRSSKDCMHYLHYREAFNDLSLHFVEDSSLDQLVKLEAF